MRIVRWLSAALLAVAALAVPATAHAAPTAPTAPYTALTMNLGGLYDAGTRDFQGDEVTANALTPDQVAFDGHGSENSFGRVMLYPTDGGVLAPGTYQVGPDADATHGVVYLHWGTGGCGFADSGTFTVQEFDGTGDTAVFSADYDVTCDGVPYTGSLRWNSGVDYRAVDLTPGLTQLRNVAIGSPVDTTVTFTSDGSQSPVLGDVAVDSATPATFSLLHDTCSGATVAYGTSCSVVVRTAPLAVGSQTGKVTFTDDADRVYRVAFTLTAIDPVTGTYYPVDPQRVVDTRYGIGSRRAPLGAGQSFNFYPRGANNQQKASAVVLNLTVANPSTSGYLTLYPSGTSRPRTSSINYTRAWTGANLVTVPVDAFGRVAVYNSAGSVAVIADIVGWYAAPADVDAFPTPSRGGGYHPTLVQRIFDTRTAGFGKLPGGYYVEIPVRYQGDRQNIGALSVTITAANMTGTGYLTTWNGYYEAPSTSTLNYTKASGVVSNAAVVPTSYCPPNEACNSNAYIAVQNQGSTPVDVIVDISGYYDRGDLPADVRFHALPSPTRIIDTRSNLGTSRFGANTTRTIKAPTSVAGIDTIALDANITAAAPTDRTYLTVWPKYDDYPRPQAAVLNPLRGQTVADHVVAEVGYGNLFNIYNFTGATDVTMDVGGTFELFPPTPPGSGKRVTPHSVTAPPGNVATAGPVLHRA